MPGILVAGFIAASLSAPNAPALRPANVTPPPYKTVQVTPSRSDAQSAVKMVCGMRMVIGDASLDPGILMNHTRKEAADENTAKDKPSCGGLQLVRPIKR